MKHRAAVLLCLIVAVGGWRAAAFAETSGIDPREVAIDKTLGGMAEGSRILSPQAETAAGGQRKPEPLKSSVGSGAQTQQPAVSATAPQSYPAATEANHGVFVHGSIGNAAGLAGSPQEGTGANIGTGTETALPGGNTGTGGGSEQNIIEVNADANLETDSPTVTGGVAIDTNAGGGLLDANTETTTAGGQETTSSANTPAESGGEQSIIEADAGVDVSGGSPTVEAEVAIDPNANGGLVDAEAAASADVIEQELTSNAGLEVDVGTDTTTAETTTVGTETGSTNASATNEVTGGVEADVEGAGAGDDKECNPADGFPCPPKL